MMVFKVSSVKTRRESVFIFEGLRKCGSGKKLLMLCRIYYLQIFHKTMSILNCDDKKQECGVNETQTYHSYSIVVTVFTFHLLKLIDIG